MTSRFPLKISRFLLAFAWFLSSAQAPHPCDATPLTVAVAAGENGPYVAPDSAFARHIATLNGKLETNPSDGVSLSQRAIEWAKCDAVFHNHDQMYFKADGFWVSHMMADIQKAAQVEPKNPQVFANIAVAFQIAAAREVRDHAAQAGLSPQAAATLRENVASFESGAQKAFQSGLELGDSSAAGQQSWFLLKKIARADSAARPPLISQLLASAKLAPADPTAILCRVAALSVLAPRPEVRAAALTGAEKAIDALALSQPQETHELMSRIARVLNLVDGEAARRWQTRAASIPGITLCPDNQLLAYTFKKDHTDAELEAFVFRLSYYFEPSPFSSDKHTLLEGLAARKAQKGDFQGASTARIEALMTGGKPGNVAEAGDMAFQMGEYRNAAALYETFQLLSSAACAGHPHQLEAEFARALLPLKPRPGQAEAYESAMWSYPEAMVKAHQALIESQLKKTPDNAVLKQILVRINARFAGEKPETAPALAFDSFLTTSISNEEHSFRLYAPKP